MWKKEKKKKEIDGRVQDCNNSHRTGVTVALH